MQVVFAALVDAAVDKGADLEDDFGDYDVDSFRVSFYSIRVDPFGLDDWRFTYDLNLVFD